MAQNKSKKTQADKIAIAEKQRQEAILAQTEKIKKDYPEVITGLINMTGKKDILLADDGKQYLMVPFVPQPMYEYQGIKDGQKVSISLNQSDRVEVHL